MTAPAYVPQVLVDLFARAGAPDTDRPAWLAERRGGITATEVRDLFIRAKSTAKLCAVKLEQEREVDLGFMPRIRYGKDREAVIAERLRGEGFEPEARVFRHAENSRWLASPDGIRVDFDENVDVSEIKTDEHGITPGATEADDSPEFRATGYRYQCLWVMFVTGARRCRLVIEECIRTESGFEPGEIREYWIERDEDLIAQLVETADAFLAALDDMRENGVDAHAIALLEDALRLSQEAKDARAELEAYCASTGLSSLRIPEGSMSYSTPAPRRAFQQTAFKSAHPAMYAEFEETVPPSKPTLRMFPKRIKNETEEVAA